MTHPERRYTLKPNFIGKTYGIKLRINSNGIRDDERPIRDDAFRIAVFGDSMTFGQGVELDRTFPKIIEQKLNGYYDNNPPVQVFNFGTPSYNTVQEYRYMKEALPVFRPNMVIVEFTAQNDTVMVTDESAALNRNVVARFFKDLGRYLYSYDFLASRFYRLKYKLAARKGGAEGVEPLTIDNLKYRDYYDGWNEAKKAFRGIKELCDKNGIILVFAIFANNTALSADSEKEMVWPVVSKVITALKDAGVKHIVVMDDALRQYAGREGLLWVNPQDSHFSVLAHELVGGQISDYISGHGLIRE